jgi:hypothetical protein
MYSVTSSEWEACREHLRARLGRFDGPHLEGTR